MYLWNVAWNGNTQVQFHVLLLMYSIGVNVLCYFQWLGKFRGLFIQVQVNVNKNIYSSSKILSCIRNLFSVLSKIQVIPVFEFCKHLTNELCNLLQCHVLQGNRYFKEYTITSLMKKCPPHQLWPLPEDIGSSSGKQNQRNGGGNCPVTGGCLRTSPQSLSSRSLHLVRKERSRLNRPNLLDLGLPKMATWHSHQNHQGELLCLLWKWSHCRLQRLSNALWRSKTFSLQPQTPQQ